MTALYNQLADLDPEFADAFEDFSEDELLSLTRVDIHEVLPDKQKLRIRKKAMEIVEGFKAKQSQVSVQSGSATPEPPSPDFEISGSFHSPARSMKKVSLPKTAEEPTSSRKRSISEVRTSSSVKRSLIAVVPSPEYTIPYDAKTEASEWDEATTNRIIRETISSMVSEYQKVVDRLPSTVELEAVTTALLKTYPLMASGHRSPDKKMKKRLSKPAYKPVKRQQGKVPQRGKKSTSASPDAVVVDQPVPDDMIVGRQKDLEEECKKARPSLKNLELLMDELLGPRLEMLRKGTFADKKYLFLNEWRAYMIHPVLITHDVLRMLERDGISNDDFHQTCLDNLKKFEVIYAYCALKMNICAKGVSLDQKMKVTLPILDDAFQPSYKRSPSKKRQKITPFIAAEDDGKYMALS